MPDDLTIVINRGADPVLITGDERVVRAVIDALVDTLRGPTHKRVLALTRQNDPPGEQP